ncbi:MAG: hypothetical protein QXY45_01845 [Candidatus Aenigmatarchaeota archaeon]
MLAGLGLDVLKRALSNYGFRITKSWEDPGHNLMFGEMGDTRTTLDVYLEIKGPIEPYQLKEILCKLEINPNGWKIFDFDLYMDGKRISRNDFGFPKYPSCYNITPNRLLR